MRVAGDRADVRRLVPLYAVVLALHVAGIGLFVQHGGTLCLGPAATGAAVHAGAAVYAGAGVTAYLLGVRHAFDADHIAAIDDSTRFLMQRGRRPLGVGLAFSLGHSTVRSAPSAWPPARRRTVRCRRWASSPFRCSSRQG